MTSQAIERAWYVFAELPSGEKLVPGKTEGCPGPDTWGACPAHADGKTPACAGASWFYGPEPSWRFQARAESSMCPFIMFDPLELLPTALD